MDTTTFSKQPTPDDFIGIHLNNIAYPESTVIEIKQNIRNQSSIFAHLYHCSGIHLPTNGNKPRDDIQEGTT